MQNEIIKQSDLLKDGMLVQKGWARDLLLRYTRKDIKAGWHRIKEWDYYCILTADFGAAFTIADNGYMGLLSVTWLDFKAKTQTTECITQLFTRGGYNLPETSAKGNISVKNKKASLDFLKNPDMRIIRINFPGFEKGKGIKGEILLKQDPEMDSMVIATPFPENPHAFYYNQKINCMTASGYIVYDSKQYEFKQSDSFGVLDWGRGVWPYSNTWYWGSGSGIADGKFFGFNIGYGFGNTSAASENMLFYNGRAHKLDEVTFHINPESYLKPWKFTSSDSRFEMTFEPIIDRYDKTDILILKSIQHQVFGYFTGDAVLDNGKVIHIDRFMGFAEKVHNKW